MDKLKNAIPQEKLKGTKTEENLHTAMSGESQAYLRYLWFSAKAKKEGYVEISRMFEEIAANEKEHAEIWFQYLGGAGSTEENLNTAAGGEHFEWSEMYAEFAEVAKEEGFAELAARFRLIAGVEKTHEGKYTEKLNDVREDKVFSSEDSNQKWVCLNCGYEHTGKEPPTVCPACVHDKGYFAKA